MFPILISALFVIFLVLALWEKTKNEGTQIIAGILGVISFFVWLFVPIMPSIIQGEIAGYNQEKIVVQAIDLKGLSDFRKAQVLESFITQDKKMRYYKKNYNGFWFGIYIPNEDCEKIELLKGW
jgi:hypothetical protein